MALVRMPIEVDITYVNKTWFSAKKKKDVLHYVIGLFQREGEAIIRTLPDNKAETITEALLQYVEKGSMFYVEHNILPVTLSEFYEIHELKDKERSNGDVHVNHVKNMWKDLKRTIKQTHVQVSQKHLQLYCNEVAWRVNHRNLSPYDKFNLLLSASATGVEKKTTYNDLIK